MPRVKVTAEPGTERQGSQGSTVTNFVWKHHIEICDFGSLFCDVDHLVTCFGLLHALFFGTEQMHFVSFFFCREGAEGEEHLLLPVSSPGRQHQTLFKTSNRAIVVSDLRGHPTKV